MIDGIATGGPNSGDIAIDDLKITNGRECPGQDELCAFKCPDDKCIPEAKVCDFISDCLGGEDEAACGYQNSTFENDLNNWSTNNNTLSKWVRTRNGNDGDLGPSVDHTTETSNGYYIHLVKNSQQDVLSENAIFRSPVMRNTFSACQMRFWYQINSGGIGRIDTYVNIGQQKSLALRLTEQTYNQWYEAIVNVGTYKSGFFLSIEANRSYAIVGNIAVDDVSFRNCTPLVRNCTFSETKCNNGACMSSSTRYCDLNDDCGNNSDEDPSRCVNYLFKCDFESGFCEWNPDSSNQYNWQRTKANEALPALAPRRDHTTNTGSGSYIYIETRGSYIKSLT